MFNYIYIFFGKLSLFGGDIIPFLKYSAYVNQICALLVWLEKNFILYFDDVVEDWTFPGWDTFTGISYIDSLNIDSHKNSYVYIWRRKTFLQNFIEFCVDFAEFL
jgi:hypothetical protein